MEVARKAKLAVAYADAGGRDRLSSLPDCLLHDILSRLKARQVVQTCVLSRRWQHLWLTSPCLDVDISEFLPHAALHPSPRAAAVDPVVALYAPPPLPLPPHQRIERMEKEIHEFEDFVDCLLVHRSAGGMPTLDTLRLRLSFPASWPGVPPRLNNSCNETKHTSWVRRGLRCSPAALHVTGFVKIPALASSSTRRLTKLRLDRVFLHRDFGEHLASGLPVLEDLEITGTDLSGLTTIASGTLKHLAVDSSTVVGGGWLVFSIVAPRLASFHLAFQFIHLRSLGIIVHDAPQLVRASIRLVGRPELRQRQRIMYNVQDDRLTVTSLCKLIRSLSHVRDLELYGFRDMTPVQQHILFDPLLPVPPGDLWMQTQNFLRPQIAFMQPPGPGVRPHNYHQMYDHPWIVHQPAVHVHQPAMPPMRHPMLETIFEDEQEHGRSLVFHALTSLVLDECETGHDFQTLWRFLHNAPVLEKLTLKNCQCQMFPNGADMEQAQTILETPTVPSTLKSVEIIYDDRADHQGPNQYKVRIDEESSNMIKWKLPATTMIRVTKLPKH